MARAHFSSELLSSSSDTLTSSGGASVRAAIIVAGATITVYESDGSTSLGVTMYAAATGGTTKTNPFTADATTGEWDFYLDAPRRVVIEISKTGFTTETHTVDVPVASADHAAGIQFGETGRSAGSADLRITHTTGGSDNDGVISIEAVDTAGLKSAILQLVPGSSANKIVRSQLITYRTTGADYERFAFFAHETINYITNSKTGSGGWHPIIIGFTDTDTPANDTFCLDLRSNGTTNVLHNLAAENVLIGAGTPGTAAIGTIPLDTFAIADQSVPLVRLTHGGGTTTSSGNRMLQFRKSGGAVLLEVFTAGAGAVLKINGAHDTTDVALQIIGVASQSVDLAQFRTSAASQMAFDAEGHLKWVAAGKQQTTVGAAGGADALPATPTKYLHVKDSAGTTLVIPAYAVS